MGKIDTELLLACIYYPDSIFEYGVEESDFAGYNAEIFKYMLKLKKFDYCLVLDSIKHDKNLFEYFKTELTKTDNLLNFPIKSLIPYYLTRIREEKFKCEIQDLTLNAKDMDTEEFIATLREKLPKLRTSIEGAKTLKQCALKTYSLIEEATQQEGLIGISTGFDIVDDYTLGLQNGNLYVLASRPSIGKSALALNFALAIARQDKKVLIQSLEDTEENIVMRLLAQNSLIPLKKIQKPNVEDLKGILAEMDKIYNLPIYIDDEANLSTAIIRSRVEKKKSSVGVDILIVDHLQEIIERMEFNNRHLEISHACAMLKGLAKDLNIPVLLISQLSRATENRGDKQPLLSDLKESGDIEAKADCVMLLWRKGYYDKNADSTEAELAIRKNRNGKTGQINLHWQSDILKLTERKY